MSITVLITAIIFLNCYKLQNSDNHRSRIYPIHHERRHLSPLSDFHKYHNPGEEKRDHSRELRTRESEVHHRPSNIRHHHERDLTDRNKFHYHHEHHHDTLPPISTHPEHSEHRRVSHKKHNRQNMILKQTMDNNKNERKEQSSRFLPQSHSKNKIKSSKSIEYDEDKIGGTSNLHNKDKGNNNIKQLKWNEYPFDESETALPNTISDEKSNTEGTTFNKMKSLLSQLAKKAKSKRVDDNNADIPLSQIMDDTKDDKFEEVSFKHGKKHAISSNKATKSRSNEKTCKLRNQLKCKHDCSFFPKLDADGCETCSCCSYNKFHSCKLSCKNGYVADGSGCPTCSCLTKTQ